jgi:hypothetical protein
MLRRVVLLLAGLITVRGADCAGPIPWSCSLLSRGKAIFVGTAGGHEKGSLTVQFRVTEAFKGVKGDWIDVVQYPDSLNFVAGEQYLVFAGPCAWARGGCLTNGACSDTREVKYAAAILDQLRAEKSGRPIAAVYGTLSTWEARDPLSNIRVRLQSGGKTYAARTDGRGVYSFAQLPRGTYQVSADLPSTMVLDWTTVSFELSAGSCFANDLYTVPSGRISGRVIGPDRNPLETATVHLFRAGEYREGEIGAFGYQGKDRPSEDWKPFKFDNLASGEFTRLRSREHDESAEPVSVDVLPCVGHA